MPFGPTWLVRHPYLSFVGPLGQLPMCTDNICLDLMFGGGRGECERDDKRRSVVGTGENIKGMLKRRHSKFGSSYSLFQPRLPL